MLLKNELCIVVMFLFSMNMCSAQTLDEVSILEHKHQICLDKGADMLGCSVRYYAQMDSVLNLAYSNLRSKIPLKEKDAFKAEQRDWFKKRDKYFKEEETGFKKQAQKEEWGSDMYMILYDKEADFVRRRVIELINRFDKKGKAPNP